MVLIGAVAGWIGNWILSTSGLRIFGNMIVGIAGSLSGYLLLSQIGVTLGAGMLPAMITGILGAVILLGVVNLILGARSAQ